MQTKLSRGQKILWILFAIYSAIVLWEIFIGPYRSSGGTRKYNLIPFKTISSFFRYSEYYDNEIIIVNLIGNVVTFIPLGIFLPWLFSGLRINRKFYICSFFIILTLEGLQYFFNVGVFDIDDFILNLVGCYIGYVAFIKTSDN